MKINSILILIIGMSLPLQAFDRCTYIDKAKKAFKNIVQSIRGDSECNRNHVIAARVGVGLCAIGLATGSFFAVRHGIKCFKDYRTNNRYHESLKDAWIEHGKILRFENSIKDLVPYLQNQQITPENCQKVAQLIKEMQQKQQELDDNHCAERLFTRTMCDAHKIPSSTEDFIKELSTLYPTPK